MDGMFDGSVQIIFFIHGVIWKEEKKEIPIITKIESEYNTHEIYDNPAEYSTIKGIFTYTDIEMIK